MAFITGTAQEASDVRWRQHIFGEKELALRMCFRFVF